MIAEVKVRPYQLKINQALHLTNVRTLSAAEQLVEIAKEALRTTFLTGHTMRQYQTMLCR